MKSIFHTCVLGLGVAAMFTASALNAATFRSENVSIPFAFRVAKVALPAGEYRITQGHGSDITYLINLKTGQQVQVLRSGGAPVEGRARLVFENTGSGYILKAIS